MNRIPFLESLKSNQIVLALSAHCDDAALGCGGLLKRLGQELSCEIRGMVFSGGDDEKRKREEQRAAAAFGLSSTKIKSYPDKYLPNHWDTILDDLFKLRKEIGEDRIGMVLCPRHDDRHQDHRVIAENVRRVFRDHLILEYETPNYDGNWANPNLYVELTEEQAQKKAELLWDCYTSRRSHTWWSKENFVALMRWRGIEANAQCAEALFVPKMVF